MYCCRQKNHYYTLITDSKTNTNDVVKPEVSDLYHKFYCSTKPDASTEIVNQPMWTTKESVV